MRAASLHHRKHTTMSITDLIQAAREREAARQRLAEEQEEAQERQRRRGALNDFRAYAGHQFGPNCLTELGIEVVWSDEPGHVGPAGLIRVNEQIVYLVQEERAWYIGTPDQPAGWCVGSVNYRDNHPDEVRGRYDALLLKLGDVLDSF